MIHIELRFPAGRYHATPWGRHVNEGAIEWPPSPWRLLRAFISVGFTKLGWQDVPQSARVLIEKLAVAPPVFHLPETTAAHTRHYMPNNAKTDKVLDTFAWVGHGERDALVIEWPATLDGDEANLLDEPSHSSKQGASTRSLQVSRVAPRRRGRRAPASSACRCLRP